MSLSKEPSIANTADKPRVKIERWELAGNCLYGHTLDHPRLGATRVRTSRTVRVDMEAREVETLNTVYELVGKSAADIKADAKRASLPNIRITGTWGDTVGVSLLKFPGGEMHVCIDPTEAAKWDTFDIHAHLPDSDSVMALLLVTDALRRANPSAPVSLELPYVPYARQDRVANPGEALSARVFCELINAQGYSLVTIHDPHSDVVSALLDRVTIADASDPLWGILEILDGPVALVSPDAGARKRVSKLAAAFDFDVVYADKVRNTQTGAITGTAVQGELPDLPLLVVDDICDGGRTFTELAAALQAKQAEQGITQPLYLYVTNGIFSKGLDPLLSTYTKVFTRNNWTADTRAVSV